MAPTYHGSCLCGDVAFEVTADPIVVSCCHCKNCKKYTGTVFTTNVVFPANTVTITKGSSLVSTYHDAIQDSGNPLNRLFCSRCAAPLYNTGGDSGRSLAVFYSALDDFTEEGKEKAPQVEYYAKDRAAWVYPVDGAHAAETKPDRED